MLEEGRQLIAEGIAAMGLRLPDGSLRPEFDDGDRRRQTTTPERSVCMRFGIFYEHQMPRPWSEDAEEDS